MRYSTVPAIDMARLISRNNEIISRLPEPAPSSRTWNPSTVSYVHNHLHSASR